MRSGLVKLLDKLCSLVDDQKPLEDLKGSEDEDSLHRVTSMAWAAFQVLADHCVAWESENSAVLSSGLAKQVGRLLTTSMYSTCCQMTCDDMWSVHTGLHVADQPLISSHGPSDLV